MSVLYLSAHGASVSAMPFDSWLLILIVAIAAVVFLFRRGQQ